MEWKTIESVPKDVLVMTKIDDENGVRNEQPMHLGSGRLWYADSMYVYYTPTHWRELTMVEKLKIKNASEAKAIGELDRLHKLLGIEG